MTKDKLEELYNKYHLFVKDVAYKMLKDPHLAEDICHDVFLKLSDEWMEARIPSAVRLEYLRVAAFHRVLDYKEHGWNNCRVVSFEEILQDLERYKYLCNACNIDDKIIENVLVYQMLDHLKAINALYYEVLLRKEIYQYPVALIAKELNMKISNVYVTLHRAKTWIKEHYGSLYKGYF